MEPSTQNPSVIGINHSKRGSRHMTIRCNHLFFFVVFIFTAGPAAAESTSTHWGYFGDIDPEHWGDLNPDFAACKTGKAQSPVNLGRGEPATGGCLLECHQGTASRW